jgi:hypothetical protein
MLPQGARQQQMPDEFHDQNQIQMESLLIADADNSDIAK